MGQRNPSERPITGANGNSDTVAPESSVNRISGGAWKITSHAPIRMQGDVFRLTKVFRTAS